MKAQGLTVYVVLAGCRFNWFIIKNMASSGGHVITDLHHFSPAFTANHLWTEICKCKAQIMALSSPIRNDLSVHKAIFLKPTENDLPNILYD